jgi:hypothetical protein
MPISQNRGDYTMMFSQKLMLTGVIVAALTGATTASAQTCFTAFGGSVHYQFAPSVAAFKATGIRNVAGVTFGSLAPCAGLTHWPLIGTEVSDKEKIVLGFRAMTVDAPGCGAVDLIVSLNQRTLSGQMQLHNDRNNFSNTTTLTHAPCVPVPSLAASAAPVTGGQKDEAGNSTP